MRLAYVIYTSGSTGLPKGVLIEHQGIVNVPEAQIPVFGLRPGCRALFYLSTGFDASISDIGTALLSGATLCLESPERLRPGPGLLEVLHDRRITHVDLPPSVLPLLDPEALPGCLETVVIGGEPCPPEVVRRWARRVRVVNVYGPTETTICTSLCLCDAETWDAPLLGQPIPNVVYRVLEDGKPVPPGSPGELHIGGLGLARGYLNRPELTESKFIVHEGERLYRTGDRVVRRADGEWQFLGRIDRQVKVRGMLVEPEEIEARLLSHPGILQAAVVKRPLGRRSRQGLAAFVALRPDASPPSIAELRRHLGCCLPSWMLPQRFEFLPRLPVNDHGKVDLAGLAERELPPGAVDSSLHGDARLLAETVALVLGSGTVDLTGSFLDQGGDSLAALETCTAAGVRGLLLSPSELMLDQPLEQLLQGRTAPVTAMSAELLRQEVAGDPAWLEFLATARARAARPDPDGAPRVILLTGATGFLGARLLGELLRRTDAEIHCLVRADDGSAGRQRILSALRGHEMPLTGTHLSRIVPVIGDLEKPRFGLDRACWARLAESVDTIHHCAAQVNMVLPWSVLKTSNVEAVRTVLQLAGEGRPKRLHHASTLSVFVASDRNSGRMEEADDLARTQTVYGGYAQTKWAAEVLLRQAGDATGPACIYRLGLITGDSRTGYPPGTDFFGLFCRGVAALGCVPDVAPATLKVDVTPVDFAASALAWLSLRAAPSRGVRTFHIANPSSLTLGGLLDALAEFGVPIETLPEAEWRRRVLRQAGGPSSPETAAAYLALCRALGEGSPGFARHRTLDLFQATAAEFVMDNTRAGLAGSGLTCPAPDATLLRTYLRRLFPTTP